MGVDLNEEVVNDTAKLVMHRLIARQLSRDPSVLLQATTYLKQMAERYPDRSFVGEWEDILKLPLKEIQSKLTSRNEEMTRLRLSSPFVLVNVGVDLRDVAVRRRIWKLARRIAIRSTEDAFTSFQGNCQAEIARLMLFKVTRDRFLKASKKLASAGDVDPEMLAEDEAVIEPRF